MSVECKLCEGPHLSLIHFLYAPSLQLYEVTRAELDGTQLFYGVLVNRGIVVGGAPRVADWGCVGEYWTTVQKNLKKRGASIRQVEIEG